MRLRASADRLAVLTWTIASFAIGDIMEQISAIITTYNYQNYLPEALSSLLAQTFPLHEIIVVDDGSTDNTRELVQAMMGAVAEGDPSKRLTPKPKMVYIYQENQGLAVARNTGIAKATGSHILILDADDRVSLCFAAKCTELLRRNSGLSGAYTWQAWFGIPEFSLGQVHKNGGWNFQGLTKGNYMNDCSLYKIKVWEDVALSNGYGYDPDMWGWCGWEFYIHAGKLGHTWGLVEEPLYFWRRGHKAGDGQPTLGGRAWQKRGELMSKIMSKHPELY